MLPDLRRAWPLVGLLVCASASAQSAPPEPAPAAETAAPADAAAPAPAPAPATPAAETTAPTTPAAADADAPTEPAPTEAGTASPTEPAPAEAAHGDAAPDRYGGSPGIALPADFSLHGRFDLLFQHDGYQDNPFVAGKERIRNNHHFVFLSRNGASDPFGLDVELVDLTFYEVSFTHHPAGGAWRLSMRGGKILVPFGPEPVFHTMYGGRIGADQKLMPQVWARLGTRVGVDYDVRPLGIQVRNDAYAVQGYRLPAQDAVLDLQSDFDEEGFGLGDRVGVAWGACSAWYSLYANSLGFGRRLFMQAFDAEVYRWPDVPVIDRLAVALGAVRADVSGGDSDGYGGPGEDDYHFATYFQVRVFPLDWLYVQYRQGITTIDNRRGLFRDETRLDERDNATHNLAVGARYLGLTATLSHAWNLEQKNEIDDDYLRLMVAYDF